MYRVAGEHVKRTYAKPEMRIVRADDMRYYGVRWDLLQEARLKYGGLVLQWARDAEKRDREKLLQNTGWRAFVPGWVWQRLAPR